MRRVSVVLMDLDNTLWDWLHIWHTTFLAEFSKIVEISGLDPELLQRDIKEIHRKHRTSEYVFLIQEIPSLKKLHPGEDLLELYAPAIQAYRLARREVLALYPGVRETLEYLRGVGCLLVAYTESFHYFTDYRVRKLKVDGLLDYLYSPDLPPSAVPHLKLVPTQPWVPEEAPEARAY